MEKHKHYPRSSDSIAIKLLPYASLAWFAILSATANAQIHLDLDFGGQTIPPSSSGSITGTFSLQGTNYGEALRTTPTGPGNYIQVPTETGSTVNVRTDGVGLFQNIYFDDAFSNPEFGPNPNPFPFLQSSLILQKQSGSASFIGGWTDHYAMPPPEFTYTVPQTDFNIDKISISLNQGNIFSTIHGTSSLGLDSIFAPPILLNIQGTFTLTGTNLSYLRDALDTSVGWQFGGSIRVTVEKGSPTPVPEPADTAIFACGSIAVLGGLRKWLRRRRR